MKTIIKNVSLLLIILTLFGCVNKKAIKVDEFDEFFTNEGFEVTNAYDPLVKKDNIKGTYIAKNDRIQIELYVLNTIENAKKFYLEDVKYFKKENVSNDKDHNYESFSLEEDGKYIYISRIDKTVIFSINDIKYKDEINDILEKINY